eukprot:8194303-Karenia_brevis.AAC.1
MEGGEDLPDTVGPPDVLGHPWPSSTDTSFLVLPGKGNSSQDEVPGPDGPQYPANMVAELESDKS